MKINKDIIAAQIRTAEHSGCLEIKDHRGNLLSLQDGKFCINGVEQLKTKHVRETMLLESFKLSRQVKLNGKTYIRNGSGWVVCD